MAQKIIMVLGPTASGKTKFGVNLAANINGEIIGADSRQVYRGLDIGSGKDLAEYTLPDGRNVPYHLIDIREPGEEYSLADFLTDADRAINDIASRGKVPCIVGGTALYLHGLLSAYQLQGGAPDMTARNELRQLTNAQLRDTLRALDENNPILTKEPENRIRLIRAIELARGGDPDAAREPDLAVSFAKQLKEMSSETLYTYCASCTGQLRRSGAENAAWTGAFRRNRGFEGNPWIDH